MSPRRVQGPACTEAIVWYRNVVFVIKVPNWGRL